MSKDVCLDCGMLLSPRSKICEVCGFDNSYEALNTPPAEDYTYIIAQYEEGAPENHPGF